jgi:arylformamidase
MTPTERFDRDFFCLNRQAVEWLVKSGAVLVGVDGPSVDPVESEALDNHRALDSGGIAILENLDLTFAAPGAYTLIALPLRIPGADATWVRAVLTK